MATDPQDKPLTDEALERPINLDAVEAIVRDMTPGFYQTLAMCLILGLREARREVALARERLGPAGWKMVQELMELREDKARSKT